MIEGLSLPQIESMPISEGIDAQLSFAHVQILFFLAETDALGEELSSYAKKRILDQEPVIREIIAKWKTDGEGNRRKGITGLGVAAILGLVPVVSVFAGFTTGPLAVVVKEGHSKVMNANNIEERLNLLINSKDREKIEKEAKELSDFAKVEILFSMAKAEAFKQQQDKVERYIYEQREVIKKILKKNGIFRRFQLVGGIAAAPAGFLLSLIPVTATISNCSGIAVGIGLFEGGKGLKVSTQILSELREIERKYDN